MLRLLSIKCQDHEPGQGWKEDIWELGTSYIGKRGTRYPIIVFYTLNTAYDNRSRSREGGEGESLVKILFWPFYIMPKWYHLSFNPTIFVFMARNVTHYPPFFDEFYIEIIGKFGRK